MKKFFGLTALILVLTACQKQQPMCPIVEPLEKLPTPVVSSK